MWSERMGFRRIKSMRWLVLMIACLMGGPVAVAQPLMAAADRTSAGKMLLAQNGQLTLEQAVAKAKAKYKGKVLSASRIDSQGPLVYRIKMLSPDSRVHIVYVDANNGDVFKTKK